MTYKIISNTEGYTELRGVTYPVTLPESMSTYENNGKLFVQAKTLREAGFDPVWQLSDDIIEYCFSDYSSI